MVFIPWQEVLFFYHFPGTTKKPKGRRTSPLSKKAVEAYSLKPK